MKEYRTLLKIIGLILAAMLHIVLIVVTSLAVFIYVICLSLWIVSNFVTIEFIDVIRLGYFTWVLGWTILGLVFFQSVLHSFIKSK